MAQTAEAEEERECVCVCGDDDDDDDDDEDGDDELSAGDNQTWRAREQGVRIESLLTRLFPVPRSCGALLGGAETRGTRRRSRGQWRETKR